MHAHPPAVRPFHVAVAAFVAGTDSPRDLLERCIAVINEIENDVQAFEYLDLASARHQADASAQRYRAGTPTSSIDGIPFGVKDIIETADMPTGMGSPLFTGWRGGKDAASVVALREAGAVIVGKTVTTEFAATVPGKTHNPWDLARTPGGSSSGSAAAVGHVVRGARHASDRFDSASSELLWLRWLQTERRRHQPRWQPRFSQSEHARRPRRNARRCLARRA